MLTPRPYQLAAANAIKDNFFNGVRSQVVQLPTGTGKTVLFAMLPDYMEIGDRRMLVIVHREELAQQAADKLRKWNPSRTVGIEMAGKRAGSSQIVVASVQTLSRSAGRIQQLKPEDFCVVVTDECHHATSPSYRKIYDYFDVTGRKDILNLGVTATVNRSDGKPLKSVYSAITHKMSILDAIRQGWLADLKGKQVRTNTELDGVSKKGGDFDLLQLSSVADTPYRNELIAQAYIQHGQDRKFLGFAIDVAHAKNLAKAFKKYGVNVEAVWGGDVDRALKLSMHRKGQLQGLFNCELLTEGYDDWSVQALIMARPTQSESLYTQMMGRGTRIPEGINNLVEALDSGIDVAKRDCLVLDIADLSSKHSLSSLPSLFGMGKGNLNGKSVLEMSKRVEDILKKAPSFDLNKVDDLSKIETYVQEIDLFKVATPPEIIQLTKYRWFKTYRGNYVLSLANGEYMAVIKTFLGDYNIQGIINKQKHYKAGIDTLDAAITEADRLVTSLGGTGLVPLVKRKSRFEDFPPSPNMLSLARQLKIKVPNDATRGMLRDVISKRLLELKWRKNNGTAQSA